MTNRISAHVTARKKAFSRSLFALAGQVGRDWRIMREANNRYNQEVNKIIMVGLAIACTSLAVCHIESHCAKEC